MAAPRTNRFIARWLRGRVYWILAFLLTLAVWVLLALALRPPASSDNAFAARPYGWTTGWENQATDLLFQLRNARHPELRDRGKQEPIVIIGIDDESFQAAGLRAQSWPRSSYAKLIDRASEGGASVIGLDLLLAGVSGANGEAQAEDQSLVASMARAGNVVIAEKSTANRTGGIKPWPGFAAAAWATGFIDLPLDSDGQVRNAAVRLYSEPEKNWQLSFAAHLVEGYRVAELYDRKLAELKAAGQPDESAQNAAMDFAQQSAVLKQADGGLICGDRFVPLRRDDLLQLDFRGRPGAFTYVSAVQVLADGPNHLPADIFRNRIVLIAQTSTAGGDLLPTPFYEPWLLTRALDTGSPDAPVRTSGAELHATAIATMLFGNSPRRMSFPRELLMVAIPLLLAAAAVFRLRAWLALLAVGLIALGLLLVASWQFNSHALLLPLATSWMGLLLITPVGLGLQFARERSRRGATERERVQMMEIFGRFVSPDVAETLWQRRGELMAASERRVVTIVFTDIRNFTTLSEFSSSETVVEWLNEYFTRMNRIVIAHGGHINKYIGDGLMIVFGAPLARDETTDAEAAVDCGLEMLAEVERIRADWRDTDRPQIKIGVGIHTGEATCGVVGSPQRLEYTIIGDTVNLSARLESKTKELGVPLLLSEATRRRLGERFSLRALGAVEVKGKATKIEVFTVDPAP